MVCKVLRHLSYWHKTESDRSISGREPNVCEHGNGHPPVGAQRFVDTHTHTRMRSIHSLHFAASSAPLPVSAARTCVYCRRLSTVSAQLRAAVCGTTCCWLLLKGHARSLRLVPVAHVGCLTRKRISGRRIQGHVGDLDDWAKPGRVATDLGKSLIYAVPTTASARGTNYPVQLTPCFCAFQCRHVHAYERAACQLDLQAPRQPHHPYGTRRSRRS